MCFLSGADTFPCYEILDGKGEENYVDLVCNSSHFVRMKVDKEGNRQKILDKPEDSITIEEFIKEQKPIYLKLSDEDKELFDNYVSFISIKHSFGSAISLRVLIENFFKKNFIDPALTKFLSEEDKGKLFSKAKNNNTDYLSEALHTINFKVLIDLLKNNKPFKLKNSKTQSKLRESINRYITENAEGKTKILVENELTKIYGIFNIASKVIHGNRYDTNQIFLDSKPLFEILMRFYQRESEELGD